MVTVRGHRGICCPSPLTFPLVHTDPCQQLVFANEAVHEQVGKKRNQSLCFVSSYPLLKSLCSHIWQALGKL